MYSYTLLKCLECNIKGDLILTIHLPCAVQSYKNKVKYDSLLPLMHLALRRNSAGKYKFQETTFLPIDIVGMKIL